MVKATKYVVKNHFKGVPKVSDFEVVQEELPPLKDGEYLVKAEYLSVDPYMRAYNPQQKVPYDQFGYQVAVVKESKNPKFPVGSRVVHHEGWRDYTVVTPNMTFSMGVAPYLLPVPDGLSPSLGVGALGMPGATAYFGFLEICKPQPGETVVVTGAAGAVGSIVGQIAKIKGCKVIGFAGSDEKVRYLVEELGFTHAINYRTADVAAALKTAAPQGVDCYFDNVGGEISSIIISQMNIRGRVSVCGSISSYNEDVSALPKATILQPSLVFKQLKVEGFMVFGWRERMPEAYQALGEWVKSGQLKTPEHVTEGFDQLVQAFTGMLQGDNVGKALVKV